MTWKSPDLRAEAPHIPSLFTPESRLALQPLLQSSRCRSSMGQPGRTGGFSGRSIFLEGRESVNITLPLPRDDCKMRVLFRCPFGQWRHFCR